MNASLLISLGDVNHDGKADVQITVQLGTFKLSTPPVNIDAGAAGAAILGLFNSAKSALGIK